MAPVFSFLIANYNTRPFAREMLESIKAQTFPLWEAVIVDDASTDGGIGDIIAEMREDRFKFIQLEQNMGASYARNIGFKQCHGQYIVIVDSDDMLLPGYLEEIHAAFQQNTEACAAYVDLEYFGTQSLISKKPLKDAEDLTLEQWIPHPGACLTREVFEKSGGYYEGKELRHGNLDWDFFLSIAQNTSFNAIHIAKPLYRYRQHGKNMTHSRAFYEYVTRECMYRRHKEFFDRFGHSSEFLATGYYESAAAYWAKGDYGEAILLATLGAKLHPPLRPALPCIKSPIPYLTRLIATLDANLTRLGANAYAPTEDNFSARQELVLSYATLKKWKQAKEHTCILLGMAIGNDMPDLGAMLSVQLALICEQLGKKDEAAEAANLALVCNPYNSDALAINLNNAIEAGKTNLALGFLKPWLQIKNFDLLKKIMPFLGNLGLTSRMDCGKIQLRLKEIINQAIPKKEVQFGEKMYSIPLGRRLIWEYRARDLYETYGNTAGGQEALKKAVELSGAKNVLEIGCGNGRNLAMLSAMGLNCVGQDISATALEFAKQRNMPNTLLHCGHLAEMDFKENAFDLIVSNRVLQHLSRDELDHVLEIMTRTGKFIYLNESLPTDAHSELWYLKKYDLPAMLAKHNFRLMKKFEGEPSENAMLFAKDFREKK